MPIMIQCVCMPDTSVAVDISNSSTSISPAAVGHAALAWVPCQKALAKKHSTVLHVCDEYDAPAYCGYRCTGKAACADSTAAVCMRLTTWPLYVVLLCDLCYLLQVRAAAALSNIRQVDEEELEVIVGSTIEKPTVIDFYATWCGPCLLLAQELEKVGHRR